MGEAVDEFRAVVKAYVQANNGHRAALAEEFKCALSTVDRWWVGTATPGPNLQKAVIEWIRGRE